MLNKSIFILLFTTVFQIISFADIIKTEARLITGDKLSNKVYLEGEASVIFEDSILKADNIHIDRNNHFLTAEGHVIVEWGSTVIKGNYLEYNLETKECSVKESTLNLDNSFTFKAENITSINNEKFILDYASFTSCPENCDFWSFFAKRISVKKEGYATFRSLKFKINDQSYVYLPVFIFPAKKERSTGLLIPEIGSSSKHGFNYRQELYIPIGNSHDVTIEGDYHSKSGTGTGLEYRISRKKGEYGRFYTYSINDKLINKRRSLTDISYSNFSDNNSLKINVLNGNDYNLIRDFNFNRYDYAFRNFFSGITYEHSGKFSKVILSANSNKILFKDQKASFKTQPLIQFSLRPFEAKGYYFRFTGQAGIFNNQNISQDDFFRAIGSMNISKSSPFSFFKLVQNIDFSRHQYSDDTITESYTAGKISLMGVLPALVKHYGSSTHRVNIYADAGYRFSGSHQTGFFHDTLDYLDPDGAYVRVGADSILLTDTLAATGGISIEKSLNSDNNFYDTVFQEKQSEYSRIKTYFEIPFKNMSLNISSAYNPSLNNIDYLLFTGRFSKLLTLSYLKSYTYGEDLTRDSLVASFRKQINSHWSTELYADYDFKLSDFRYKRISLTYFNTCIGFKLSYLNNTYSNTNRDEIIFTLVLDKFGELFKYKMGFN